MLDLVVKGGTVVTAGSMGVCDLGVEGEKVVQLGGDVRGRREVDARGKYVFPGGVDVHVHLTLPFEPKPGDQTWCDDFHSGSQAALAGGVTTIGNMTFQRPESRCAQALPGEPAALHRVGRGRARHRLRPRNRGADLHRPPLIGGCAGRVPTRAGRWPARVC